MQHPITNFYSDDDLFLLDCSGDGDSDEDSSGEFKPPPGTRMQLLKGAKRPVLRSNPHKQEVQQRRSPRKSGPLHKPPSRLAVHLGSPTKRNEKSTDALISPALSSHTPRKRQFSPESISVEKALMSRKRGIRGGRGRGRPIVKNVRSDYGESGRRRTFGTIQRGRRGRAQKTGIIRENGKEDSEKRHDEEKEEDVSSSNDESEVESMSSGFDDDALFVAGDFSIEEKEGKESILSGEEESQVQLNGHESTMSSGSSTMIRGNQTISPIDVPLAMETKRKRELMKPRKGRKNTTQSPTMCRSNPYDEPMTFYQRKMRDSLDLYRFMGLKDNREFGRRPVYRPFLLRNLFYMRHTIPPAKVLPIGSKLRDVEPKLLREGNQSKSESNTNGCNNDSRTSSRISNKFPAIIRPRFIRNNLCLGQRSALVQCFHLSEINGKLGQLKRIATFEMKVNQHIQSISIDLPDELYAGVLDGEKTRVEYLVLRVIFRFEDAEIGGRRLRKVPSRQSTTDGPQAHQLRKDGPAGEKEVVMLGAQRLFSYSSQKGLRVIGDEASIELHAPIELLLSDLDTKSSAGQLTRLINAPKAAQGSPFVTIVVRSQEDDDNEDEDECCETEKRNSSRKRRKISDRDWVAGEKKKQWANNALETEENGRTGGRTNNNNKGLFLNGVPPNIALKFWMRQPGSARVQEQSSIPPCSPPGQRRKVFSVSSSDCPSDILSSSSLDNPGNRELSSSFRSLRSDLGQQQRNNFTFTSELANSGIDPAESSSQTVQSFKTRIVTTSICFFCFERLRLPNLWTLFKHLRFVHPRFEFTYEPAIAVDGHLSLPGFTVFQNIKFDPSLEIRPIHAKNQLFVAALEAVKRKRARSKPVWLITKHLAKKVRSMDDFPLERYTTVANGWFSIGEEYIRCVGRFDFEPPAQIDQSWLTQSNSRKLDDITDLHPAERSMMQLWNSFLLRIRITLYGRKMLYKALRVFVKYHWQELSDNQLRTHFMLHLTNLMLSGAALDEDERYDLLQRLDPRYEPETDDAHFVGRELVCLESERRKMLGDAIQHKLEKIIGAENIAGDLKKNSPSPRRPQQLKPVVMAIKSWEELKTRYEKFTTIKRLRQIWKFMQPYDVADFDLPDFNNDDTLLEKQ